MESHDADGSARTVRNAVILSIVVAVAVEAYLLYATQAADNYSTLYLVPGSYSNYLQNDVVNFSYGIQTFGAKSGNYLLSVYMGDQLLTTRDLKQRAGVNDVVLQVPEGQKLPAKVRLMLKTDYGVNEVHFWLKGRKEDNSTAQ